MARAPVIAIDARYLGARPSGIGEMTQALVRELPPLAPDWRFVVLRRPDPAAAMPLLPNMREQILRAPANSPATMWWLPQIADLQGIDLFHAPFNIMPAGLGMPCVVTVHDVMWLTHPHWCRPGLRGLIERPFYRHGIRRAFRRAAAIVTVSEATRQAILAQGGVDQGRVQAILSGVAADFQPARPDPALTARLGVPHGARYVLCVGQSAPYKNHAGALAGFARAFAGQPDMHLLFVQRRHAGADGLARLARRLGVVGQVHWSGPIARSDLVALYAGATALLHPSWCEGFGNPLAEAMACGCPVVTSACSAMPEVAGGAALLVDPTDTAAIGAALRRIASQPALAARLRARGLARARQLSWQGFARAHLALYARVLAAAPAHADAR